jgi:hypothetical protein
MVYYKVMVLLYLTSAASDEVNGRRFDARNWRGDPLPPPTL